jgi:hypothetical protein
MPKSRRKMRDRTVRNGERSYSFALRPGERRKPPKPGEDRLSTGGEWSLIRAKATRDAGKIARPRSFLRGLMRHQPTCAGWWERAG